MQCHKCKHNNPPEAMFCMQCGAKLERKCPNCGAEYPEEAIFCMKCGTKLKETSESTVPKLEDMQKQLQDRMPKSLADRLFAGAKQMQGEYRLVTALFADVSGSSTIARKLPLEQYVDIMDECFKMMVDTISIRYEGSINRFIGDCVLAFFGAPITHENDAERAILAAIDIRDAVKDMELNVSIGINTGNTYFGEMGSDLLYSERSAWGPDVDFAKRLQEAAQPGQILVGPSTYRVTRRAFDYDKPIDMQIKGSDGTHTAYPVINVSQHPEKLRGIEGLRARMIGREREFGDLKESADNLTDGRGSIVTIIGEAGLGKSRLASELKTYLKNKEVQFYEGRCISIGQTVSYWPFLDILRTYLNLGDSDTETQVSVKLRESMTSLFPNRHDDILPFIANLLSVKIGDTDDRLRYFTPEQIRHQTLMRLKDIFTEIARQKPLLLILEDLHWADDLSLDLISLLMDDLTANPLMLLCIYRPEKEHRCWQLGDIASRKCLDRYVEITLRNLTSTQSRELVESLLAIDNLPESTKGMILRKSEGNPFFIEEVIRYLIDRGMVYREGDRWVATSEIDSIDVPDTIQSVVLSRVDRLESETRYVLQCASVIGRLFRYRLLDHISQHERNLERHLSELEDKELILEERTVPEMEYSFKHAFTQESTYQGILERRRREFHNRVAEGIENLYMERLDDFYEELAYHHRTAGNLEKAIDYLLKSGVKLADQYANQQALEYLNSAEELLNQSSLPHKEDKALLYDKRGDLLERVGKWSSALKEYDKALELCKDKYVRAEIHSNIALIYSHDIHEDTTAEKYVDLGLNELPEGDESVQKVRLEQFKIDLHFFDTHPEDRNKSIWRHIEIAERKGYKQELASLYCNLVHGSETYGYAQKAISIAQGIGDISKMADIYSNFAHRLKGLSKLDEALKYQLKSIELAENIGYARKVASGYLGLGNIYNYMDEDEKAIENYEKGFSLAEELSSPMTSNEGVFLIETYAKNNQENKVLSVFSRTMRKLASLEIDEEMEVRSLLSTHLIGLSCMYPRLYDCYRIMNKESEFTSSALKALNEMVSYAKSRPQKAWYNLQLMDLCMDLGDKKQAQIHAQQVISIIEDMGYPDHMAFCYPVYLFLGELDKAEDMAIKYLLYESNIYGIGFLIALIWKLVVREYEKYGYDDALNKLTDRIWDVFGDKLKGNKVTHLLLEKVDIETDRPVELVEEFNQDLLPSVWEWMDPNGKSIYNILKPGVEINVPAAAYYQLRRYPGFMMETSGDFILETCIRHGSEGIRSGGLLAWQDWSNYARLSVYARVFNQSDTVSFNTMSEGRFGDPGMIHYIREQAWLRLARKGDRLTGYISPDGKEWYCCGHADLPLEDPIQVGIFADCNYYPSTSTRFEYFKIYRPK